VGRLAPQKALDRLLAAVARVRESDEGVKLVVVGDGQLRDDLERFADVLGLGDAVVWCGERQPEEILPAFDIFALPSIYESFPYVVLEAMAAGLPIVASDVGGVATLVEDGKNGFLVSPSAVAPLAHALNVLVSGEQIREQMGCASLEKIRTFTAKKMTDQVELCYGASVTRTRSESLAPVSLS
jgi:glycosyltransferase involved in cell wall biosynthesis